MIVVDASVAVEYLLKTAVGTAAASSLDSASLAAPELLDAEVLSVLRRETLAGRLREQRASEAIDDLRAWHVERIAHRKLVADAWKLRANFSAYDALYLAVAIQRGATLMTADGPLARAPAAGVVVHNVRQPRA